MSKYVTRRTDLVFDVLILYLSLWGKSWIASARQWIPATDLLFSITDRQYLVLVFELVHISINLSLRISWFSLHLILHINCLIFDFIQVISIKYVINKWNYIFKISYANTPFKIVSQKLPVNFNSDLLQNQFVTATDLLIKSEWNYNNK